MTASLLVEVGPSYGSLCFAHLVPSSIVSEAAARRERISNWGMESLASILHLPFPFGLWRAMSDMISEDGLGRS